MVKNNLTKLFLFGVFILLSQAIIAQNKKGIIATISEGTQSYCFGGSSNAFDITISELVANKQAFGSTEDALQEVQT